MKTLLSTVLLVLCVLPILSSFFLISAQTNSIATVKVVPTQNAAKIGDILTINVTISDVQNLYGIDYTLSWNSTALQILKVDDRLGVESFPDGVLHITPKYPIQIAINETLPAAGSHHIAATSQGEAASFYGNGVIASFYFNVTNTGKSSLNVISELADHPEIGETNSEPITHNDIGGTVNTELIPEFPETIILTLVLFSVAIGLLLTKKLSKKQALDLSYNQFR